MNDASDDVSEGSGCGPRPKPRPAQRLLIGYEHSGCSTNIDVILPVDGPIDPADFEPTAVQIADRYKPMCLVCFAPMDLAVWGPHDDEVESRWPFGSLDASPRAGAADPAILCSFCGKDRGDCKRLISGRGGSYICGECVDLCATICDESEEPEAKTTTSSAAPPAGSDSEPPSCASCNHHCNIECACSATHHYCGCECHLRQEQWALEQARTRTDQP